MGDLDRLQKTLDRRKEARRAARNNDNANTEEFIQINMGSDSVMVPKEEAKIIADWISANENACALLMKYGCMLPGLVANSDSNTMAIRAGRQSVGYFIMKIANSN